MKKQYLALLLIVFLVGAAGLSGCSFFKKKSPILIGGDLSIHFLELGNKSTGDSIYIKCGDIDILIDAGSTAGSAATITKYLGKYMTDNTLDFVIATHNHSDHVAAFPTIFNKYEVDTIIDFPRTGSTSNAAYRTARDKEVQNGANHYTALECYREENGAQKTYILDDGITMEILYNYYYENDTNDENNYSVCLMFRQGPYQYLFTGDLERDGEDKLADFYEQNFGGLGQCKLFKAGHHGSYTASHAKLLAAITPEYVVFTCPAGTGEYTKIKANQFPSQAAIDRIAVYTDKIFVTTQYVYNTNDTTTFKSFNGDIVFALIENEFTVTCSNHDNILKNTEWFLANRIMPDAWLAA